MAAELDALTVESAQRGDRDAQEAFLRRYLGPMHALIRRSGAPGDPDDLTQDLLQKLLIALPRFDRRGPARLTTWVFTIAQRWLIDETKRRHLRLAPIEEGELVADSAPGPEQLLERRELEVALEAAVKLLPKEQRRVFLLVDVHQRPAQEVAIAEGVPIGTIKSRLHRARAALMRRLGHSFVEKGDRNGSARGA
jgi:RNA polymerase sigma-70 factor, ECF subfamily